MGVVCFFYARLFSSYGVSLWPLFPQDKESFFEKHRTQKKRVSFFKESSCISFAGLCFATFSHLFIACLHQTIAIYFCDGWLERRTVDSSKIQTNFLRAM